MKQLRLMPVGQPPVKRWNGDRPWDRQPCDTNESWAMFRTYLTLPIPRDLATHLQSRPDMREIALHARWEKRAQCWDNWVHAEFDASVATYVIERGKEVADRHLQLIEDGLELAQIEVTRLLAEARKAQVSGTVKPAEVIKLTTEFIKLHRLVSGQTTERIAVHDESVLDDLPIEDLQALERVQARLLKGSG